jgi:hypothetical protein
MYTLISAPFISEGQIDSFLLGLGRDCFKKGNAIIIITAMKYERIGKKAKVGIMGDRVWK